jgi:hypothetical protein
MTAGVVPETTSLEAGRLHGWREKFWSRRYRSIVVADEKAVYARLRYIMAHGVKEDLVAKSGDWPGPQSIAALTKGERLGGTWFNRSAEFVARQRGDKVLPTQFASRYDIKLTPLPCHSHLSPHRRQSEYRRGSAWLAEAAMRCARCRVQDSRPCPSFCRWPRP